MLSVCNVQILKVPPSIGRPGCRKPNGRFQIWSVTWVATSGAALGTDAKSGQSRRRCQIWRSAGGAKFGCAGKPGKWVVPRDPAGQTAGAAAATADAASLSKVLQLPVRGGLVRLRLGTELERPSASHWPPGCCASANAARSAFTASAAAARCSLGRHLHSMNFFK